MRTNFFCTINNKKHEKRINPDKRYEDICRGTLVIV